MAAKCLCAWVIAINTYDRVAKKIEPKKAALKGAEDQLKAVMQKLEAKRAQLKAVEDKVAKLQAQFEESMAKKQSLKDKMKLTEERLVRAVELTGGLAGEKKRKPPFLPTSMYLHLRFPFLFRI